MPAISPNTKILLDGGDPNETLRVKSLLGFLDGQTTNPTYVSKNPEVQRRIASGHKLSWEEQKQEYKDIVSKISPLVGSAGVSIEVFADFDGFVSGDVVGRGIQQTRAFQHAGRIGQPNRIPVRFDLSSSRPTRTGAAVKVLERGRVQEQSF